MAFTHSILSCISEACVNWPVVCFQYRMSCAPCPWQRGGSPADSSASTAPTCGTSESASSYKTAPSLLCGSYSWPISKWSTRCWCSLLPRISWWWCYSSTAWWCWPWTSALPCEGGQNAWKEGTAARVHLLRAGPHAGPGRAGRRRPWLFPYRPRGSPPTTPTPGRRQPPTAACS